MRFTSVWLAAIAAVAASSCLDGNSGARLGTDVSGPPATIPLGDGLPGPGGGDAVGGGLTGGGAGAVVIGDGCATGASDHLCLALKYVAYLGDDDVPTAGRDQAIANVRSFNALWAQCNLGFQIEEYSEIVPRDFNLSYDPRDLSEMTDIRQALSSDRQLLVVTTGAWDRTGTLGDTGANAWTAMPGSGPYGSVLEEPVASYSPIIGHELGHYLDLDHVSDDSNLMNPVIYTSSVNLTPAQCTTARAAAKYFWLKMFR